MSNKTMSDNFPKEIFLLGQDLEFLRDSKEDLYNVDASVVDILGAQIKYISEEHFNKWIVGNEKEFKKLLKQINCLNNNIRLKDKLIEQNKEAYLNEHRYTTQLLQKNAELRKLLNLTNGK